MKDECAFLQSTVKKLIIKVILASVEFKKNNWRSIDFFFYFDLRVC